ncbi:hypothetical protein [Emticicia sp. 17c]|uniref:hypothetical protein n=1 Tax=Emticicia sp. 17c TaxID=3127704 RepID=UPI00301CE45E
METNKENFEKFINFHRGEASEIEKQEILALIGRDEAAREEFEEMKFLEENIRLYHWQKEAEMVLKKSVRPSIFTITFGKIALAASVILLTTFTYLLLNRNYLPDIIIEQGTLMGEPQSKSSTTQSAQEVSYNLFLMGKASYYADNFSEAIKYYHQALATPNLRNQFYEALKWHLCIAYLRNGEPEKAQKLIDELEKIENPKYKISALNKLKIKTQLMAAKIF